MFKVNNKDTKTTPMTSFGVFIVDFEHISHHCYSVSVVNFEHVIAGWESINSCSHMTNISCTHYTYFLSRMFSHQSHLKTPY